MKAKGSKVRNGVNIEPQSMKTCRARKHNYSVEETKLVIVH